MNSDDIAKIQELLARLRHETNLCLKRINDLEKELSAGYTGPSMLSTITDPIPRKNVAKLLEVIGYETGDSLRKSIKKLEDYIIEGEHIDFQTLSVIPDKIMANALRIPEDEEISYEELIGKIPRLFKLLPLL